MAEFMDELWDYLCCSHVEAVRVTIELPVIRDARRHGTHLTSLWWEIDIITHQNLIMKSNNMNNICMNGSGICNDLLPGVFVRVQWLYERLLVNSSHPGQNSRHFAADTFKCILLNENVCILIRIAPKFAPEGPNSGNGLAPNWRQAITWTNAYPDHWRIYAALGGDELIFIEQYDADNGNHFTSLYRGCYPGPLILKSSHCNSFQYRLLEACPISEAYYYKANHPCFGYRLPRRSFQYKYAVLPV